MLYEYFFFMELFANNYLIYIVEMSIQYRSHDQFVLKRHSTCWIKNRNLSNSLPIFNEPQQTCLTTFSHGQILV